MESIEQITQRVKQFRDKITTEQATITSLIMPFFKMLGYDTYNPLEVIPEFTADVAGIKKGEKVDLAIIMNDKPIMVVECKPCNADIGKHSGQLSRYFHVTEAKFGILTNGIIYQFFADLDKANVMDEIPFLELNLLDEKDVAKSDIMKFHKKEFDADSIFNTAQELKYTRLIKTWLRQQTHEPDHEFIRLVIQNAIHANSEKSTKITQNVINNFTPHVKHSLVQFLDEQANERLQDAIQGRKIEDDSDDAEIKATIGENQEEQKPATLETTLEEFEAYAIVKSILRDIVDVDRLAYRHSQNYMSILFDDNRNKRICRLWFKGRKKYITTPDADMNPIRHDDLSSLNDIYNYSDYIREVCSRYI